MIFCFKHDFCILFKINTIALLAFVGLFYESEKSLFQNWGLKLWFTYTIDCFLSVTSNNVTFYVFIFYFITKCFKSKGLFRGKNLKKCFPKLIFLLQYPCIFHFLLDTLISTKFVYFFCMHIQNQQLLDVSRSYITDRILVLYCFLLIWTIKEEIINTKRCVHVCIA